METDTNIVDYESTGKKFEEAQNRSDFWNPKEGKFEIVILSELSTYQYQEKDKQGNLVFTPDGKPVMQVRAKVDIESSGKQYVWSFGIGATKASTYGQLIDYALKHNKKLTGNKVTIVIKNDGKKRDFTIV
jgi:hypothetical protein